MQFYKQIFSSHKKCFICKCSLKRLHRIKSEDILKALRVYKILIKNGTRFCGKHKNKDGFLNDTEFKKIPTEAFLKDNKQFKIDKSTLIKIFDSESSGVFDRFKDFSSLDEKHCFKITRWTKQIFYDFSKYITSINESKGRNKYELIAIYRYWLRKGIDQCSLAMFKNNSSQQKISRYLKQIRMAINKDFVPFFLGAKSRQRKFYIERNNVTTIELFDLKEDDLAIFADATYTRLEKSSNNIFQYNCWSQQKMDLLIKPFLICCADGYIIDCYGPFQANMNDAKIFEYVLQTDLDLIELLLPNKTFAFLDRGISFIFDSFF